MATGNFSQVLIDPFTYAFFEVIPYAVSFYIFGYGIPQAATTSLCEYVLLIILTFLLARKLIDESGKYAMLAAFFTAITPFVVLYATRILPDMLVGVFFAALLYFYLSIKRKGISYFFLGIIAALGIYVKTEVLALLGIFALFVFLEIIHDAFNYHKFKHLKADALLLGCFIAGLIVTLGSYLLLYYHYFRAPFFIFKYYTLSPGNLSTNLSLLNPKPTSYDPELFSIGLIFYYFIAGGIIAISKNNKRLTKAFLVSLGFLLYLILGTDRLTSYTFIPIVSRFFAAFAAPFSLLGAYFVKESVNKMAEATKGKFTAFLLAAALIFALVLYNAFQIYTINSEYNAGVRQLSDAFHNATDYIINASPKATVYVLAHIGFNIPTVNFTNFEFKFSPKYNATSIFSETDLSSFCNVKTTQTNKNVFILSVNTNKTETQKVLKQLNVSCNLLLIKQYVTPSGYFLGVYTVSPTNSR